MKNLFKLTLSLLLLLVVASCSKDDQTFEDELQTSEQLTSEVTEDVLLNPESSDDCFTINYPYSLSNGETSTQINNDQELADYLLGLGNDDAVFFVYPLNVTLADGSTSVIDNEDALYDLVVSCIGDGGGPGDGDGPGDGNGDGGDDPGVTCFEVLFPHTIVTSDGFETVVNNPQELLDLLQSLPADVDFGFGFPLDVQLPDGSTQTVNNQDELDALAANC